LLVTEQQHSFVHDLFPLDLVLREDYGKFSSTVLGRVKIVFTNMIIYFLSLHLFLCSSFSVSPPPLSLLFSLSLTSLLIHISLYLSNGVCLLAWPCSGDCGTLDTLPCKQH